MTRIAHQSEIPLPIERRLREFSEEVTQGKVWHVRLLPLILERPIEEVLRRRASMYTQCDATSTYYGHRLIFSRQLKPSRSTPAGRRLTGSFDILQLSPAVCIIASSLDSDAEEYGPCALANLSYPYARRPFVTSSALCDQIEAMGELNDWRPISMDAIGYDRETHKFRRDMKRQPLNLALREMREQCRDLHRCLIMFKDKSGSLCYKAAFDRYGTATLLAGRASTLISEFVLPLLHEVRDWRNLYSVEHAKRSADQKMVELVFAEGTFANYDDMSALCRAVRKGDGLSVTTVHMNPYLQTQVLDFFTGAAIQLVVLNDNTVSVVPRSQNAASAIERVVSTIFRFFGEGQVRQSAVEANSKA